MILLLYLLENTMSNINNIVYNIFESKDLPGYSRGQVIRRGAALGVGLGGAGGMAGGMLGRFVGKKINKGIRNKLERDLKNTKDPAKKKEIQKQISVLQNRYDKTSNSLKNVGKDAIGGALVGGTIGAGGSALSTAGNAPGTRYKYSDVLGKRLFRK